MKRAFIAFLISIMLTLIPTIIYSQEHVQICIDPGHGGPGASKYGINGDGRGSRGPLPDGKYLSEQWVNLQVSFTLKDSVDTFCPYAHASMTRSTETTYVLLQARADSANYANCDFDPVFCATDEFIPIHHNGFDSTKQGIETFWCDEDTIEIGSIPYPRNNIKMFAQKVYWRLRDKFTYPPYEERKCRMNCNYWLLENTTMISCYSEATNLSNPDEAILFDDPNLAHVKEEAGAIYRGWRSYFENNGIVTVDVRGLCDAKYKINVDGVDKECPYYTSWTFLDMEAHTICAYEGFFDSCGTDLEYFTLHHLKELETGLRVDWPPYNCLTSLVDPAESTHTFFAYYTGGPYYANLFMPDGGDTLLIGDEEPIIWAFFGNVTSVGLDSTTLIDVYLDRNSGQDGYPETLFTDLPRKDYPNVPWEVTDPPSNNCRIKIVAEDCVENTASDASTYDFVIRFPNIMGDVNTDGNVSVTDITFLVNFLYKQGPPPEPLWKGDVNGNCEVGLSDIVYLVNYLYKSGPPPEDCNPECDGEEWDCNR